MSNPWDNTPSIWDGWVDQCFGRNSEPPHWGHPRRVVPWYVGGELAAAMSVQMEERMISPYCAGGYLLPRRYDPEVVRRACAVEYWLVLHFDTRGNGIVFANDHLRWTPEEFRELDRRLEWRYQQERFRVRDRQLESERFLKHVHEKYERLLCVKQFNALPDTSQIVKCDEEELVEVG